jgi:hypothetical protein
MKRCIHVNSVNVAFIVRYVLQCLSYIGPYHVVVSMIVYSTWRVLLKTIYIYIWTYVYTYVHDYVCIYVMICSVIRICDLIM